MLTESISRNSILLGIFAIATTAIVAGTFLQTQNRIIDNKRHAEERALIAIVPKDAHDNSMLDDFFNVDDSTLLSLRKQKKIYIAKMKGNYVGVIIPATARDGYTGDIDLIVGIKTDGSVAGVRILNHRETPGLGDKVDYKKSQWVDGFIGHSLTNTTDEQWAVKRDGGIFDQFTGATITPRAVTAAVKRALDYFQTNRDTILPALEKQEALNNG
jgi:electron transport complex protein RnfG